jgi:hypothetical protein
MNAYDFVKYIPVETKILAQTNTDKVTSDRLTMEETDRIDQNFSYGVFTGLFLTSTIVLLTLFKKYRFRKKKSSL